MESSSGSGMFQWKVPVEMKFPVPVEVSSGRFQWKWKLPVEGSGKSGNFQWNVPVKVEVPAFHWNFHFYRKLPAETSAIFLMGMTRVDFNARCRSRLVALLASKTQHRQEERRLR